MMKNTKLLNFYSPHRCGSMAVNVFKLLGLQGENKKSGIGWSTLWLLNKAALKAQDTTCPLKHE